MKKIDTLIDIIYKIYLLLESTNQAANLHPETCAMEDQLTRQQVKDYLHISESTLKRKLKDGSLKPLKTAGGIRFKKQDLLMALQESINRGRI